jgi:hypothetical protein
MFFWFLERGEMPHGVIWSRRMQRKYVQRHVGYEAKGFRAGDWVKVRSRVEIAETLNRYGRQRGLKFVPEMYDYCGRRMKVMRRVEKICVEGGISGEMRDIRNTVLLEGSYCQGGGMGCDRCAFHFWREVWLDASV